MMEVNSVDKLRKIIEHAYCHVPFYRKNWNVQFDKKDPIELLQSLPVVEKKLFAQAPQDFLSDNYSSRQDILIKSTSGSTGKCLYVYWSRRDDIYTNYEAWIHRKKWYDVTINDKYATFHTTMYLGNRFVFDKEYVVQDDNHISFNKVMLTKNTVSECVNRIGRFGASILLTQPSTLELLIHTATKETAAVLRKLKYIEFIGEYCSRDFLEYVQRLLPNVRLANMYGATETGYIALTCPYGHQHVLGNTFVEVVDQNNLPTKSRGRIVVTSLTNYVMPFIRYSIGDYGLLDWEVCPCGFTGYTLTITQGRVSDVITLPDGSEMSAYSLWYAIEKINAEFGKPIVSYYFVQEKSRLIIAYLSIQQEYKRWSNAICDALINTLKTNISGEIEYQVRFLDTSFDHRKKLRFFENKIHV